jgi:hypothetical protein
MFDRKMLPFWGSRQVWQRFLGLAAVLTGFQRNFVARMRQSGILATGVLAKLVAISGKA